MTLYEGESYGITSQLLGRSFGGSAPHYDRRKVATRKDNVQECEKRKDKPLSRINTAWGVYRKWFVVMLVSKANDTTHEDKAAANYPRVNPPLNPYPGVLIFGVFSPAVPPQD